MADRRVRCVTIAEQPASILLISMYRLLSQIVY